MDTILYLYKKKETERPFVEAISQGTYLLVKIGMDVEPDRWFIQRMSQRQPCPDSVLAETVERKGWSRVRPGYFRERREARARRREWKRYETLMDTLTERCRANVESLLGDLQRELSRYVPEQSACRCVYDREVRDVLLGDNPVAEIWKKEWKAGEFTSYTEPRWVQQLMPSAVNHHFIVLGEARCIPGILHQYADRMKSLRWIVEETSALCHGEELEDFAEDFYQEQGLAVTIEQVQGQCGFGKLRPVCREPANILDFTGEDKVSAGWAPGGSVWLDMWSLEEKGRRIARRNEGIQYFSLREKWRRTEKRKSASPPSKWK